MNIGVHWLIKNQSGSTIDLIEKELRDITNCGVDRTETVNAKHNYDAVYIVKGDISAEDLLDACTYMDDVGAHPV